MMAVYAPTIMVKPPTNRSPAEMMAIDPNSMTVAAAIRTVVSFTLNIECPFFSVDALPYQHAMMA